MAVMTGKQEAKRAKKEQDRLKKKDEQKRSGQRE